MIVSVLQGQSFRLYIKYIILLKHDGLVTFVAGDKIWCIDDSDRLY